MGAWVQKCDQKDEMPARPGVAGVWTLTQGQDGQKSWRREDGEDTGRVRRTRARRLPAWALNRGRVKAGAAPAPLQVAWAHRPLPLKVLAVHGPSCQGAAPDPIPALI